MVALATQVPEGLGALLNEITLEALAKWPQRVLSSRGRSVDNSGQSAPAYWRGGGIILEKWTSLRPTRVGGS